MINWRIPSSDTTWAFGHLASHVIQELSCIQHCISEELVGDVNVLLTPVQLKQHNVDSSFLLHMDSNRWYTAECKLVKKRPVILCLIWELNKWSWGLTFKNLQQAFKTDFVFKPVRYEKYKKSTIPVANINLIFCQNITQVRSVPDEYKINTVARLGGIMNFVGNKNVEYYMQQMSKCGAIITTNMQLYWIAKSANPNTYMLPNGIDITKWCPNKNRKAPLGPPVVGFVGNINSPAKRAYKGYDLVESVTTRFNLALSTALYKHKQIPHDQMKELFYDRIDLLILPTDGEGCSNTLMEAMACGVPVITTKTAGFHAEAAVDGEEIILCDKTQESIDGAVRKFLFTPGLYDKISKGGRAFAERYHDIRRVAQDYKKIFDRHFLCGS